jgi:hypothetical protein
MAGDWIKMRSNIDHDWRVVRMAELLGLPELHIVGCLWKVWSWADQNTVDGNAICVTDVTLERYTGVTGFAYAMRQVGWLKGENGALCLPNFLEHNGQTAKKRAQTQVRVAKHRNASSVTKALPEKRREEKKRDTTKVVSSVRPTIEQVAAYCKERNNTVDPQKWFDHYTANGWKIGKNPMKDWQAAVRTWEQNDYGSGKASGKTWAQQTQSNVQQMLAKAAADDAAAGRVTATTGFLGVVDGK